jgi:hypothetical protein
MTPRTLWSSLLALTLVAGCAAQPEADTGANEQTDSTVASDEEAAPAFVGQVSLDPISGPAGTEVTLRGEGLPASETLSLLWSTVEGSWVLEGELSEEYMGRQFEETQQELGTAQTDEAGNFEATFVAPEDFGFAHDVLVADPSGEILNRALFRLDMEVSITPTEGPPGTPITIEVKGMGWQTLEDTRTITYDNDYVGFMSAVTTNGTARAVIPATGTPGPHQVQVLRGAYTFPYRNPEQSPRPDIPTFDFVFTVTDDEPILPAGVESQNPEVVAGDSPSTSGEPWIATSHAAAPVGEPVTISGSDFEADTEISIQWFRIVGNRVSGQGWDEQALDVATLTADADGKFSDEWEVPTDVGGPHRIEARVNGETVAETWMSVLVAAQPLPVTRGPWGTDIEIKLTGVGWTETANIYAIVYDNSYLGYACGFNTQGDVTIPLTITGDPGWHFIDLYPAIYKGDETPGRDNFRIPQLTALDDHPGEDLPIFRYAFYIEG